MQDFPAGLAGSRRRRRCIYSFSASSQGRSCGAPEAAADRLLPAEGRKKAPGFVVRLGAFFVEFGNVESFPGKFSILGHSGASHGDRRLNDSYGTAAASSGCQGAPGGPGGRFRHSPVNRIRSRSRKDSLRGISGSGAADGAAGGASWFPPSTPSAAGPRSDPDPAAV